MARARFVALVVVAAACRASGAPSAAGVGERIDPCLIPAREGFVGAAAIGTHGAIDVAALPHLPRTPADSLVFAHVYETLVNVTCDGRLVPGIAERWSDRGDTSDRTWTFHLRPDAAFNGGIPVNAENVADAWRARRSGAGVANDPRALAVDAITVESSRSLTVHFRDPQRDGPRALANAWFSVHRPGHDSAVTLGTGPFSPPRVTDLAADSSLTLLRVPVRMDSAARVVQFVRANDQRDLIDRGVNLLRTRDRRAIEYAATRGGYRAQALPADRAYVLVSAARASVDPVGTPPSRAGTEPPGHRGASDPRWDQLRAALARDVLRRAEPQRTNDWWLTGETMTRCGVNVGNPAPTWSARALSGRPRRLVFAGTDPLAAALAQRLVVLAADDAPRSPETDAVRALLPELLVPEGERLVASGVSNADLAAGLLAGADAAYIVALPRRVFDPCAEWRAFMAMVPWARAEHLELIVESAQTLLTNRGAPGVTIDWVGTLRVVARTPGASQQR